MSELEKEIVDSAEVKESKNFIEQIIDKDLAEGVYDTVHTRFPPEPNGYLHIGHAKSILLNYGLAQKYNGKFNLRFDDTNPTKEKSEFVESIKADVKWLGADWEDRLFFESNYFDQMYEAAVKLIKKGKAYVSDLSAEQIREYRGSLTEPGKEDPGSVRSVEENLALFEDTRTAPRYCVPASIWHLPISTCEIPSSTVWHICLTRIPETSGASIRCMISHIPSRMPLKA